MSPFYFQVFCRDTSRLPFSINLDCLPVINTSAFWFHRFSREKSVYICIRRLDICQPRCIEHRRSHQSIQYDLFWLSTFALVGPVEKLATVKSLIATMYNCGFIMHVEEVHVRSLVQTSLWDVKLNK